MMPFLLGLHTVWSRLDDLQRGQNARPRRSGLSPYAGDMVPTTGYHDPHARVRCVRMALAMSRDRARGMLVERLSGINLSTVLGVLIAACEDVAVIWGGSVLVGGALGGVIGVFGGGVGAVPGAALGAGVGAQVGIWILGFLGLKSLIVDLGKAVPEVLRLYEQGFRTAWGKADDWGAFQQHDGDEFFRTQDAARQFAQGHVLLMVTLLSALLAYLTRGRGDPAAKARILQEIRESPRLGPKVADWVAANEEALARHPGLKPKEQQVVMSSQAKPPAEPPMTPSQLRKAAGRAAEDLPVHKKPEPPLPPKAAGGPINITARDGVNLSEFRRLNVIDTAKGKLAPGEAGAAAELQHYLGGSLERIKTADSRADFVFSSGPHQGKTVDFMFTPNDFNSAAKANQFFEKNLARNEAQLRAHVEKADLVPLDFRFLSEQNQKLFMEVVERLPIERQAQIIILR